MVCVQLPSSLTQPLLSWSGCYSTITQSQVWPGRAVIRRMIDLLCCFCKADHPKSLNKEFKLDLSWWHQFLATWNGVSFWLFPGMLAAPDLEVTLDALGSIGFGAYFDREWFNGTWVSLQMNESIAYKKFFPIAIAAHVWGFKWSRKHILFRSDNEVVVHILNSRTSKIPSIMSLMRSLLMFAARFHCSFSA